MGEETVYVGPFIPEGDVEPAEAVEVPYVAPIESWSLVDVLNPGPGPESAEAPAEDET